MRPDSPPTKIHFAPILLTASSTAGIPVRQFRWSWKGNTRETNCSEVGRRRGTGPRAGGRQPVLRLGGRRGDHVVAVLAQGQRRAVAGHAAGPEPDRGAGGRPVDARGDRTRGRA